MNALSILKLEHPARKILGLLNCYCLMVFYTGCSAFDDDFHLNALCYSNENQIATVADKKHSAVIKGQVNYQRAVYFNKSISLAEAVNRCSGFTEFANLKKIQITKGEEMFFYNLRTGDNIGEILLEPNDVVEIPFSDPFLLKK